MKLEDMPDSMDLTEDKKQNKQDEKDVYKEIAEMFAERITPIRKAPGGRDSKKQISLLIYGDLDQQAEYQCWKYPTVFKHPSEAHRAYHYLGAKIFKHAMPIKKLSAVYDTRKRAEPHIEALAEVQAALAYIATIRETKSGLKEDGAWDSSEIDSYVESIKKDRVRISVIKHLEEEEEQVEQPKKNSKVLNLKQNKPKYA